MKGIYDMLTPMGFAYIHEAMAFQATTVRQHEISSCRTGPRNNFRMKSCVVLVGGQTSNYAEDEKNYLCQYYEEDTSCWKELKTLPQSVGLSDRVCFTDIGIVLTGGYEIRATDVWLLFGVATKRWEQMPLSGMVTVGDCVCVVGGKDAGNKVLVSVECLHQTSPHWSTLPDMTHAVCNTVVTTFRKKICTFGGVDASRNNLRCTQVFNTNLNKWS